MKKFFILTDIEGNIISGNEEFVNELAAIEWAKANEITGRIFIDTVLEIV